MTSIRGALVAGVRAIFNDRAAGERPVVRSDDALFDRGSVIWRVHGDVTTMMVGGIAALLLQMLHPAALAGVWDHSAFRNDMLGRLRRTARFIALTTYGDRDAAEAAIAHIRRIHAQVRGTLPDGRGYAASDPHLLAWVHATEAKCFLDAWIRYGAPTMPAADQDRYFAESARIARALGADSVPESRHDAERLIQRFRPELRSDERTREMAARILRSRPPALLLRPVQDTVMLAAIDLLPGWARAMHALPPVGVRLPAVRGTTAMLSATLRWAFAGTDR